MKNIVIFLDTVRKDMLKIYNQECDTITPNLDKFSSDCYIFENHCTGSLPCMPARRDLFTGRLDFFDRPWGALEPFDVVLQQELSTNGIRTHITTDHAHYWRHGGENYLQYFDTYVMNRGQESDPFMSHIDAAAIPKNVHGRYNEQYYKNCRNFVTEDDYPVAQTFLSACEYIKENKHLDSFYLQVEGFDPHEPFNTPKEFTDLYNLKQIEEFYNSPLYGENNDTPEQNEYIRTKYKANLTFADYYLGKFIDTLKSERIYDECNIIFTTDHGFHLGEHGSLGKGVTHIYNEICEIPLLHKLPFQNKAIRISEFTQNIDIMPTLLEMNNISNNYNFHGISYYPLLNNKKYDARDSIVTAYFGLSITYKDHYKTYMKPKIPNVTEKAFTAMPRIMYGYMGSKYGEKEIDYSTIENDRYLKYTDYPVYKFETKFPSRDLKTELYLNDDKLQLNNVLTKEDDDKYSRLVYNKIKELGANDYYKKTFDFSNIDK